jgi:hypothetical protein
MRCKSCGPENLHKFGGEIAIHFPGWENLDKPHVHVSPELVSAWVVVPRDLSFRELNCVCFAKATCTFRKPLFAGPTQLLESAQREFEAFTELSDD